MSKYGNIKTELTGIKYDSKKEANRGWELLLCERQNLIQKLERQKHFELQPSFIDNQGEKHRKIEYICDFYYYDNQLGCYVAEDVKSPATAKDKTYILKKKLFMYKYPDIYFREII